MAPLPRALASLLACAAGADALIATVQYTGSTQHPAALRPMRSTSVSCVERLERRAVVGSCLGVLAGAFLSPSASEAVIESNNPANNYYFPMAKYRYLPRIFRAWIASSELAPKALEERDWEGLRIVYDRLDDATLAMPLYTSAVEGSRSSKRKKKSETQQQMAKAVEEYKVAVADLDKAINRKDAIKVKKALEVTTNSLSTYRTLAQIDKEDGGIIRLPDGNPEEAGHAGAPLGYVVPAFRGGGTKNDFALR